MTTMKTFSPRSKFKFSGSTSRSYGSCAGEVHAGAGAGARIGASTTLTQLLETTPLVASCASEHSSASPISGDLPTAHTSTTGHLLPCNSMMQLEEDDDKETTSLMSHEALIAEIKRLRERLITLETENASMSIKLNQQQWEVEHRLAEIEMQICGASSGGSSTEDNERNRESII
ncbi:uncharacterized protein LOC110830596 [Zootermopsis nevadensis]|uniref:Uncharacterized protein n=1 Tax=Zootermopsis nevadensis TaxID=136037 RepID=A0A067RHN6_ZOONE|nr:uncharacterized protein LOC110830596 [Zootermopsis nevadensis]KDR18705.1 hypothetical protein L798_07013 [Zootermopsis nevadensis]